MSRFLYYVYIYFDPSRDLEPFYVGKGYSLRCFSHLGRGGDDFGDRLKELRRNEIEPVIEQYFCDTEDQAFALEAELISSIGRKNIGIGPLLNKNSGHTNKVYVQSINSPKQQAEIDAKREKSIASIKWFKNTAQYKQSWMTTENFVRWLEEERAKAPERREARLQKAIEDWGDSPL